MLDDICWLGLQEETPHRECMGDKTEDRITEEKNMTLCNREMALYCCRWKRISPFQLHPTSEERLLQAKYGWKYSEWTMRSFVTFFQETWKPENCYFSNQSSESFLTKIQTWCVEIDLSWCPWWSHPITEATNPCTLPAGDGIKTKQRLKQQRPHKYCYNQCTKKSITLTSSRMRSHSQLEWAKL